MKLLSQKVVLILFTVFTLLTIFSMEELNLCQLLLHPGDKSCPIPARDSTEVTLLTISLFLLPVLFTLPLKPAVFTAWRKFAVWAVPTGTLIIFWFVYEDANSPSGFMDISIVPVIIGLVYIVYFSVSLWIIVRTWWQERKRR